RQDPDSVSSGDFSDPAGMAPLLCSRHLDQAMVRVSCQVRHNFLIRMDKADDAFLSIPFQQFGASREAFFKNLKRQLVGDTDGIESPDKLLWGIANSEKHIIPNRVPVIGRAGFQFPCSGNG